MNTPTPTSPPPVGPGPAQPIKTAFPTLGATIGAAGGSYLGSKLHITDPINLGLLVTIVTSVVTALFHWLGSKIGVQIQ